MYKFVSFQIHSAYLVYEFVHVGTPVVLRTTAALENRPKLRYRSKASSMSATPLLMPSS